MTKRSRSDEQVMMTESLATVANYLMLLSQASPVTSTTSSETTTTVTATATTAATTASRVFECKTCNRQFMSFQALGGHRASHKKPRLSEGARSTETSSSSPTKPRTHECSICGLEFAIGQALGGHMRRHRVYSDGATLAPSTNLSLSLSLSCPASVIRKPVMTETKKTSGLGQDLSLDLNLMPLENGSDVATWPAIFG